jgi:WD40 repeat protein
LSTYRELPPLTNISFSHDYQYIAGITWEGVFYSWNLKNQQHISKKMSIKHTVGLVPVDAHTFSVYGRSGNDDHPVEATNVYAASGNLLEKIDSHSSYLRFRLSAYRARNQKWMIDMSEPNSIDSYFDILDTKTSKIVHRLNTAIDIAGNGRSEVDYRSRSIGQGAFRQDGTQAAYSTADGMIRFYDFPPPRKIPTIAYRSYSAGKALYSDDSEEWPPGKDPISSYRILPDGKVSVNTGRIPAYQYEPPKSMERDGHIYSVWNIAFSPNGKALIFWSRDQTAEQKARLKGASLRYDYLNHLFEVRNTNNNKTIQTLDSSGKIFSAFTQSLLNSFSIDGVSWSKEENLVATYIGEGCIGVWNVQTGQRVAFLSGTFSPSQHDKPLYLGSPSIAISPDNNSIAATRTDGTIYLYSLKTCLPMAQLGTATKRVAMIQFSPDGHTLYGVTNGEVRSWNVPEIKP